MHKLSLLLHDIRSTHNVGSILRSAECFGVLDIYVSGFTPYPKVPHDTRLPHIITKNTNDIHKTALGAENNVSIHVVEDVFSFIKNIKKTHQCIALEQHERSIALKDASLHSQSLLVIGREVEGLDEKLIELCDSVLEIPLRGKKESLNVAIATSLALYQLVGS